MRTKPGQRVRTLSLLDPARIFLSRRVPKHDTKVAVCIHVTLNYNTKYNSAGEIEYPITKCRICGPLLP